MPKFDSHWFAAESLKIVFCDGVFSRRLSPIHLQDGLWYDTPKSFLNPSHCIQDLNIMLRFRRFQIETHRFDWHCLGYLSICRGPCFGQHCHPDYFQKSHCDRGSPDLGGDKVRFVLHSLILPDSNYTIECSRPIKRYGLAQSFDWKEIHQGILV